MKQTISVGNFRDAFRTMDRGNNFSYEGMGALFNYIEDYEDVEEYADAYGLS